MRIDGRDPYYTNCDDCAEMFATPYTEYKEIPNLLEKLLCMQCKARKLSQRPFVARTYYKYWNLENKAVSEYVQIEIDKVSRIRKSQIICY